MSAVPLRFAAGGPCGRF